MLNRWPPIYMESGEEISVSRYKTHYGMDIHTHEYFEIEYVLSGKCYQRIKSDKVEFARGDIALFQVEARHEFHASSELEIFKIKIKPDFLPQIYRRFVDEFDSANIIHLPPNEVRRIENLLLLIEKEFNMRDELYIEVIAGYLEVLFALIIRAKHANEIKESKVSYIDFKVFISYIENNLNTVTPSAVATYSGYNFPYFSKLFKKHVGVNLSEYINAKKLETAVKLLTESDMSIENVGYEVGFNHKSYFHRIFKRYYGVTPEEYRKASRRQRSGL